MNIFCRILIIACALCQAPSAAFGFCGLYVARADGDLFNEASKVVMVRDGRDTTITMSSDYQGEPQEFAMIVPTPQVLSRDAINTVREATLDALDAFTAPRLVEYQDDDPCNPVVMFEALAMDSAVGQVRRKSAGSFGVTVKATYAVDAYDIAILDARRSDGLVQYLHQEGYNIPDGAEDVLNDYIRGGMKFFVARVNLDRHAAGGASVLKPLQIRVQQKDMMLPIRLGMVNSRGTQDLILMTLSRKGRIGVGNYPMHKLKTDREIPVFVRQRFAEFYTAMFDTSVDEVGGTAIVMEYAWDMGWCDPCAADPLTNMQLAELGVDWLREGMGQGQQDVFVTRLHARYDASFSEDLQLFETDNRENFQGRYILREPFRGPMQCDGAPAYVKAVRKRVDTEARELRALTGWNPRRIREEIAKTIPAKYR